MKKTRLLGALLAGVMAVSGVPAVSEPLGITISAASLPTAVKNIKASVTESTITLTWDKVSGADAYRVYYRDTYYDSYGDNYKSDFKVFDDTTKTTCTIDGLSSGRKYAFRIATLVKANGGYKEAATTSEKTATTKIAAPSGISVRVGSDSVTLSWYRTSGADAYRVYKYNSSKKKYVKYKDVTETSCKITGLTAGKTYKFRIASLVKSGSGYKVQGKSSVISASPVKSASSAAAIELPKFPAFGKSSAAVLKAMKATNYSISESNDAGTAYIIASDQTSLISGDLSAMYLMFNKKDQFYGGALMTMVNATPDEIKDALIKQNGESKKLDEKKLASASSDYSLLLWEDDSTLKMAQFADYSDYGYSSGSMLIYMEISKKYCPSEALKQIKELYTEYLV